MSVMKTSRIVGCSVPRAYSRASGLPTTVSFNIFSSRENMSMRFVMARSRTHPVIASADMCSRTWEVGGNVMKRSGNYWDEYALSERVSRAGNDMYIEDRG